MRELFHAAFSHTPTKRFFLFSPMPRLAQHLAFGLLAAVVAALLVYAVSGTLDRVTVGAVAAAGVASAFWQWHADRPGAARSDDGDEASSAR
ncbi:MAG: hypothetical protein BRD30_11500 [Bacteroidetes bacterium QH_2_63_10]|nr:MAG: hypothetical protein BRD30_11500 [Bacteroidetes bacterium QH_2_63_10]